MFIAVVDCPSEDYFDSLVNNQEFRKHQAEANCDEDVATLVVHFTPKDVLEHPRYVICSIASTLSEISAILNAVDSHHYSRDQE